MAKYAIVEFVDDKSVAAVPVKWLTEEEDMCCWPPSTRNFSSLVKNLADPCDNWIQFNVRVLGKAGKSVIFAAEP